MSDATSTAGATGPTLFTSFNLSPDLFLSSSWARSRQLSALNVRSATATNCSHRYNCSVFDPDHADDSRTGKKANTLLCLYALFSQRHNSSRLWARMERYQLLSRLPTVGVLLLISNCWVNGTLSPPVLVVGGPMGVAHHGLPLFSPSYSPTVSTSNGDPTEETPLATTWPDTLAPLLLTLASTSRTTYEEHFEDDNSLLRHLRANSNLAVFPDAKAMLGFGRLTIRDDARMESTGKNDVFASTGLWAEHILEEGAAIARLYREQITTWISGAQPPSPLAEDPWSELLEEEADEDASSEGTVPPPPGLPLPFLHRSFRALHGQPISGVWRTSQGGLLLSKIVLLSEAHGLPIGVIVNPTQISFNHWLVAMGDATSTDGRNTFAWLDQPVIRAW